MELLRILPGVSDVMLFLPYTEDVPLQSQAAGNSEAEPNHVLLRNGNTNDVYTDNPRVKLWGYHARTHSASERHARCLVLDSFRGVEHTVIHLNRNADMWWPLSDEMPHRWVRVDLLTPRFMALLRYRSTMVCNPSTDNEQKVGYEEIDRPGNTAAHNVRVPWCPDALEAAMGQGRLVEAVDNGATRPGRPAANVLGEACWRLARTVRGCSVGLALSGGGTWGASHIGVLRELERQRRGYVEEGAPRMTQTDQV